MISIPSRGELHAAHQIEIRNQLEDGATITEIVPEGKTVREGDLLIKLADDKIIDRIKGAQDTFKTTESALVAAQQAVEIQKSAMASELDKAELEIELSRLAKLAWSEGELLTTRQNNDINIETAQINLERLLGRFEDAKKLLDKGFISKDEYEIDRISLIQAEAAIKQAKLAKEIYEAYQIKQDRARFESAVEQNTSEHLRVKQRNEASLVGLNAAVKSADFKHEIAEERLADLERQLEACTVLAPNDGLVVYASSLENSGGWRGRGDEPPPQIGSDLRPNELVMILPDTGQMVAHMKVGEALSGRIKKGQLALVFSDSMPEHPIKGAVDRVSVLAESGGWRDPNRREYTVIVMLDADESLGLKPSMRCRGEIILGDVEDALSVPIQAVFREGQIAFVYVPKDGGFAPSPVSIGRSSEMEVEILDGLTEGDTVLLRRPKAGETRGKLSELASQEAPRKQSEPSPRGNPSHEGRAEEAGEESKKVETSDAEIYDRRDDRSVREG
jgi:HlyD family secretion protein